MACRGSLTKTAQPPIRYLTKSLVRAALSCPRKLVYAKKPEIYPRNDDEGSEDLFVRHLAEEGRRFGYYCQQLFSHGKEIGMNCSHSHGDHTYNKQYNMEDEHNRVMEDLVLQTKSMLLNNSEKTQENRVTIFEGVIRSGPFMVRPDILDKIIYPQQTKQENDSKIQNVELRVIEVKSKCYDSRQSTESKFWTANRKSIKSTYLTKIQDVAFQTFVARQAFPEWKVTSWLMMPDRAKCWRGMHHDLIDNNKVPTVEETLKVIDESVATLLNVDELVETVLIGEVFYPGKIIRETFIDAVEKWAKQINEEDLETSLLSPAPIGSQCASCEYRLKHLPYLDVSNNRRISGFDSCWHNASGLDIDAIQQRSLIVDLYGYSKELIKTFVAEKKYLMSDLSADDFVEKKKSESIDTFSISQRQYQQVLTAQNESNASTNEQHYMLKRESLLHEMEKWQYPLHFIDFETASPILPYYPDMSPYDVIAFQFSHHILKKNTESGLMEVHHASEFLQTERGTCPNEEFLHALYNAIGTVQLDGGTIFQWSSHENTVLSSILKRPKFSSSLSSHQTESLSALLQKGSNPMIDLSKLAKDYYYVDGSSGSTSLKRLLSPTIRVSSRLRERYQTPTYNSKNFHNFQWYQVSPNGTVIDPYEILAGIKQFHVADDSRIMETNSVVHGGGAVAAFHELQCNISLTEQDREGIVNSLLRYCELDTLSMAMIVQAWQGFLEIEA